MGQASEKYLAVSLNSLDKLIKSIFGLGKVVSISLWPMMAAEYVLRLFGCFMEAINFFGDLYYDN